MGGVWQMGHARAMVSALVGAQVGAGGGEDVARPGEQS